MKNSLILILILFTCLSVNAQNEIALNTKLMSYRNANTLLVTDTFPNRRRKMSHTEEARQFHANTTKSQRMRSVGKGFLYTGISFFTVGAVLYIVGSSKTHQPGSFDGLEKGLGTGAMAVGAGAIAGGLIFKAAAKRVERKEMELSAGVGFNKIKYLSNTKYQPSFGLTAGF